jgi:hypothetical protein
MGVPGEGTTELPPNPFEIAAETSDAALQRQGSECRRKCLIFRPSARRVVSPRQTE